MDTKDLLEDIQLEHSNTVREISFDSECCQKFEKKKKWKYGDSQIEKKGQKQPNDILFGLLHRQI